MKELYYSQKLYLLRYWRFLLVHLLLFFILILALINIDGLNKLGPIILFFTIIIGWITGTGIFKDVMELRTKYTELSIEEYEDPTSEPWRLINHSISDIKWNQETKLEHIKTLSKVWKKHVHWQIGGAFPLFERLLEETGTINYRVLSMFKRTCLIRIHKTSIKIDIDYRNRVANHLEKENVFNKNFINFLKPIKPYERLNPNSFIPSGKVYMEIFPYVHKAIHFKGESMKELASFADLFGKLQYSLQKMNDNDKKFFKENKNPRNTLAL